MGVIDAGEGGAESVHYLLYLFRAVLFQSSVQEGWGRNRWEKHGVRGSGRGDRNGGDRGGGREGNREVGG